MTKPLCAFLLLRLLGIVWAALPLPSPPFLPPPAASGAVASPDSRPNAQWSMLLGNLLYFYEAQRSGKLPAANRVPWRNDSALGDGQDVGLDLSGGYYDAGDYVKFTYPLSFVLTSICWGALDAGAGYDLANQTAYLDSMLRWGLDWLIEAHPSPNTLFVQVGDANTDDAYWGGDQGIPLPRLSYQINNTSPGTDAAASSSAAFSSCAALYAGQTLNTSASLPDANYSQTLLLHSQELLSFALNASGGLRLYQVSVPTVAAAYGSSSYQDDLALAALFLAFATNSSSLCDQAADLYSSAGSPLDQVLNWDSKTPALPVLFTQIAKLRPDVCGNLSQWQGEAETYFDAIVNGKSRGFLTQGGLLFYDGDSDDASLNPALNAAMILARYAPLSSNSSKSTAYANYAASQVDYALGRNAMSVPYVVGSNPNSPSNPHSAMASGGDNISAIDTSPPQEAYVLYGAVVGGPTKQDLFWDIRSDWPETEVALDYNAPLLTIAAMNVMNNAQDPYFTSLQAGASNAHKPSGQPCDAAFPCNTKGGLSKGLQIAIAVIFTVVGLGLAAGCVYLFTGAKLRKRWTR